MARRRVEAWRRRLAGYRVARSPASGSAVLPQSVWWAAPCRSPAPQRPVPLLHLGEPPRVLQSAASPVVRLAPVVVQVAPVAVQGRPARRLVHRTNKVIALRRLPIVDAARDEHPTPFLCPRINSPPTQHRLSERCALVMSLFRERASGGVQFHRENEIYARYCCNKSTY